MIRFKLTEHTEILPGVRKRRGATVMGLPDERVIELVTDGKLEPVDYKGLPEGYPRRDLLIAHKFYSIEQVESATDKQLVAIDGIGPKTLSDIRNYKSKSTDEEE